MKKYITMLAAMLLCAAVSAPAFAITYFPGVTGEMTDPSYWSSNQDLLATAEEIMERNEAALSSEGTHLANLKALPESFDGALENEKALQQARENKAAYLGWTFDGSGKALEAADFDALIAACDDPGAEGEQSVRYAIATERTQLMIYPTDEPILDDPEDLDFDYRYNTAVRLNEPLLIYTTSADGQWYNARSTCYTGWVKAGDVAICADRDEWLSAWDYPADRALVVYGDKLYTEDSNFAPETANRLLTMGTTLELAAPEAPDALIGNRVTWHNHVVYFPVRGEDGTYRKQMALISENRKVHVGFLPLTSGNLASVALEALGDVYGWGGMLRSDDCSGYVRNIYKCFGLELARDSGWQMAMPVAGMDISGMSDDEKRAVFDRLPLGAVLFFKGHEMLFLGSHDGQYYVVNSVSSMLDPWDNAKRQRVRGTVITTLDAQRANGNAWITELNYVNIPYLGNEEGTD